MKLKRDRLNIFLDKQLKLKIQISEYIIVHLSYICQVSQRFWNFLSLNFLEEQLEYIHLNGIVQIALSICYFSRLP